MNGVIQRKNRVRVTHTECRHISEKEKRRQTENTTSVHRKDCKKLCRTEQERKGKERKGDSAFSV